MSCQYMSSEIKLLLIIELPTFRTGLLFELINYNICITPAIRCDQYRYLIYIYFSEVLIYIYKKRNSGQQINRLNTMNYLSKSH